MAIKAKYWALMPPPQVLLRPHKRRMEKAWLKTKILALHAAPQALLRPHNRRMEKAWLKNQNTGLKSRRARRLYCGPISVEWKMLGLKRTILGCNAAPAGLIAPPKA